MAVMWSEMMSVGVPVLDSDHKTLLGLINHLQRSIGDSEEYAAVGSVLLSLEDYAAHHFLREERMMEAARCPQLAGHKQTHASFNRRVAELKSRYEGDQTSVRARDCLTFLNSWLIEHICTTDMNYRSWVVGHAGALAAGEDMRLEGGREGSRDTDWRSLRVLVVDDNLNFCEILTTVLKGVGITEIAVVHDVESAKAALETGQGIDLLVCDWHVGKESGLDLVKWVRRYGPAMRNLPILMLSGIERMSNRDIALLAGADEFMEKPISARGLLVCLARLAAKRGG